MKNEIGLSLYLPEVAKQHYDFTAEFEKLHFSNWAVFLQNFIRFTQNFFLKVFIWSMIKFMLQFVKKGLFAELSRVLFKLIWESKYKK